MKKTLFAVLFGFFLTTLNGQNNFELGRVSIPELEQKVCPNDTTAPAAILFNKARTYFKYDNSFGFSIVTENSFRIKIYKKEGLKWANYQLPYRIGYDKYNNDLAEFTDCVTYNIENGKIVKTKLNREGVFKTAINKNWKEATITMPNVKVGSVIEFKYILKSENIVEFPDFIFQYNIPVNSSEYEVDIPGFFVYKAVAKRASEIISESKVTRGTLRFANEVNTLRTESVSFEQQSNRHTAYNIPALKEEPFVDNIENYRISIQHELEKTQFYQESVKDYSTTWEGVARTIYKDQDFGMELREKEYITQDVIKILEGVNSQTERLDVIFKFVQNKMNWNHKKGYYTDKGVKKAYIDGTGNVAEINFILMAMLNYAGIPTSPVLLSTIDNGVPIFPNRTIFNYVIASATIDGKQILLDATNKYTTNNVLPLQTLNWTGRLLREDGSSEEIKLEPKFLSKKATNLMVSMDEKGKLSGKYRVFRTDYEAFTFREQYAGMNQQNYLEKVENDFPGIQITNYTIDNIKEASKPVSENFNFTTDNQYEIIGDRIYLNPQLFFAQLKNPFVQEKRDFPIYFGFPSQEKFNVNIEIPNGFVVESIPKPIKLQTIDNMVSFIFNTDVSNNSIQIAITKDTNKQLVSSGYYSVIKDFYKQMIDKQTEKIVFKKI